MASYTIHPRTGEILTPRRPAGDRAAIEISALSDTRKLKPSPRRLPPTSTTPSNRSEASALLAEYDQVRAPSFSTTPADAFFLWSVRLLAATR